MPKTYLFTVKNVEETMDIGKKLARYLQPGDVIALNGELGAGKTSFTKGLALGLEISQVVNSPTFTLIKEYKGRFPLYHMDVYRLEDDVEDLGFEEYFYGDGISVVEWADIIHDYLPAELLHIRIELGEEENRRIIFAPQGERYDQLCEEFIQNENLSR